jgi:hypothetical protein
LGGNWLHIIFWQIVSEAAQIWQELAPHYFPADCFGGSSNLEETGSLLFSDSFFWGQLHYFPADCFGNLDLQICHLVTLENTH